jgi:hypothetical protein
MLFVDALYLEVASYLAVIAISASLGLLNAGKLRLLLITSWWLTPLWMAIWLTTRYPDFERGLGFWGIYLFAVPVFLALWAILTIFPFKLVVRAREIKRGLF